MLKSDIMDKLDIPSDKRTQINNIKNHMKHEKKANSIGTEIYSLKLEKDKDNMKKEDLLRYKKYFHADKTFKGKNK
jgi:chromosome segregation protein